MTNTFKKHIDAISSGVVTKTNVIGIRKSLNADARRSDGYSMGCTSPKATGAEINEALKLIDDHRPLVTGELHETGLKQLQSRRYRTKLATVGDIIPRIKEFRLAGFETFGMRGTQYTPLYQAIDDQHRSFFFINVPWQSGGNGPELLYR